MKRVLALLLVLCGAVTLCASPALAASYELNSANMAKALADTSAVIEDSEGNALKAVITTAAGGATVEIYQGTTLKANTDVSKIDLSDVNCSALVEADVTVTNNGLLERFTNLKSLKVALTSTTAGGIALDLSSSTHSALTELDLSGSTGLGLLTITGTSQIPTIETLNLSGCTNDGFGLLLTDCLALEELDLSGCTKLTAFGAVTTGTAGEAGVAVSWTADLTGLKVLNLNGCSKLNTFTGPAAGANSTLEKLLMNNCPVLATYTSTNGMTGVEVVDISNTATETALDLATIRTRVLNTSRANLVSLDLHGFGGTDGTTPLTLELTNLTKLEYVDAHDCENLTTVTWGTAALEALEYMDLSGCPRLNVADPDAVNHVFGTYYTTGSTNMAPALKTLNLSGSGTNSTYYIDTVSLVGAPKLASADLSGMTELKTLGLYTATNETLSYLDVTGDTKLKSLNTSYCDALETVKGLAGLTGLTTLNLTEKDLTSVDVSAMTDLEYLYLADNSLTSLDVSKNTKLKTLSVNNNALTKLDVSKNTLLTQLYVNNNKLASLDVSANTKLTNLGAYSNALETLDVSANTKLTNLGAYSNALETLDVSKNTELTAIDVHNNALAKLDLGTMAVATRTDTNPVSVVGQRRTLSSLRLASGATLDFKDLGLTEADMSKVTDVKGDNVAATVSGTVATFESAPTVINYNYDTGTYNATAGTKVLMDVRLTPEETPEPGVTLTLTPAAGISYTGTTDSEASGSVTASVAAKWSYSGTLPEGVSLTSSDTTCGLTGTPTETGTFSGTITATASADATKTATANVTITINSPTPATLTVTPTAAGIEKRLGDGAITPVTITASNAESVTWSATPVKAPVGLDYISSDLTFIISGEPDAVGSGDIVVVAASGSETASANVHYNITAGSGGSSSGGCDAGFGALALALVGLFGLKRK